MLLKKISLYVCAIFILEHISLNTLEMHFNSGLLNINQIDIDSDGNKESSQETPAKESSFKTKKIFSFKIPLLNINFIKDLQVNYLNLEVIFPRVIIEEILKPPIFL